MDRPWRVRHLPSGRTEVHVFIGATEQMVFSMLTQDFHRLSTRDVDEMVRQATTIERPPVGRHRR